MNHCNEIYSVFMLLMLHFIYMFMFNYGGEEVQNHSICILQGT
jgi:hypothetical protein